MRQGKVRADKSWAMKRAFLPAKRCDAVDWGQIMSYRSKCRHESWKYQENEFRKLGRTF